MRGMLEEGLVELVADGLRHGQARDASRPLLGEVADNHELKPQRLHVVDQPPVECVPPAPAEALGVFHAPGQQVFGGSQDPGEHIHEGEQAACHVLVSGRRLSAANLDVATWRSASAGASRRRR